MSECKSTVKLRCPFHAANGQRCERKYLHRWTLSDHVVRAHHLFLKERSDTELVTPTTTELRARLDKIEAGHGTQSHRGRRESSPNKSRGRHDCDRPSSRHQPTTSRHASQGSPDRKRQRQSSPDSREPSSKKENGRRESVPAAKGRRTPSPRSCLPSASTSGTMTRKSGTGIVRSAVIKPKATKSVGFKPRSTAKVESRQPSVPERRVIAKKSISMTDQPGTSADYNSDTSECLDSPRSLVIDLDDAEAETSQAGSSIDCADDALGATSTTGRAAETTAEDRETPVVFSPTSLEQLLRDVVQPLRQADAVDAATAMLSLGAVTSTSGSRASTSDAPDPAVSGSSSSGIARPQFVVQPMSADGRQSVMDELRRWGGQGYYHQWLLDTFGSAACQFCTLPVQPCASCAHRTIWPLFQAFLASLSQPTGQ